MQYVNGLSHRTNTSKRQAETHGSDNSVPRRWRQSACITVNTGRDRETKDEREKRQGPKQSSCNTFSMTNITSRWGLIWTHSAQLVVAGCHVDLGPSTSGVRQRIIDAAAGSWLVELVLAHLLGMQILPTNIYSRRFIGLRRDSPAWVSQQIFISNMQ